MKRKELQNLYHKWNKLYFRGELSEDLRVVLCNDNEHFGVHHGFELEYDDFVVGADMRQIRLSKRTINKYKRYYGSQLSLESVLMHEMIHEWQHVNDIAEADHGEEFMKMLDWLEEASGMVMFREFEA